MYSEYQRTLKRAKGHTIDPLPARDDARAAHRRGEETGAFAVALCTICDWSYLPRLLVLADSLRQAGLPGPLCAVCLDERTASYLEAHPEIAPVRLADVEGGDPDVAAARYQRSHQEHAWTLKPVVCEYVLRKHSDAEAVIFLDSDLLFFGSADPILAELARGSALLVHERAVPPSAWTAAGVRPELGGSQGATMGFFNSGMIAFRRDADGLAALAWWRERCMEECRDRSATGRHGDQWYLNMVPELFGGVRVIEHPGVGLAPWNARHTRFDLRDGQLLADGHPVVFYHFQSVTLRRDTARSRIAGWCGNDLGALDGPMARLRMTFARHWRMSERERELVWQPYRRRLSAAIGEVVSRDPAWTEAIGPSSTRELAADVASELRWRSYRAASRILPSPLRTAASHTRTRARRRLGEAGSADRA